MINSEDTYKELFRAHYPKLIFYATRLVGEDEAEDVVQDVFVDLWKRRDKIEMGEHILSFLYRSVYTRALNVLNHRTVTDNYSAQMEEINRKRLLFYQPDNSDVMRCIENEELRKTITKAIDDLPDKCRETFKMSYLHDLKNKEIADIMGVSVRTVEAHVYKALRILRHSLDKLTFFVACFLLLK
jgi:RNA polymerase sigma-70 factor (ECF subfamily)